MAAYRRVYDSRQLQTDCQEPRSAPEPYARNRVWATFTFFFYFLSKTSSLALGPYNWPLYVPLSPFSAPLDQGGVQMSGGERLLAPAAVSSAHLAAAGAVGGAAAAQRLAPSVSCIVRSSTRFLVVTDAAAAAAAAGGGGAGDVVVDSVSFIETTVLVGQLSSSSLLLSDCSRRRSSLGFVDGCTRGALYLSCS